MGPLNHYRHFFFFFPGKLLEVIRSPEEDRRKMERMHMSKIYRGYKGVWDVFEFRACTTQHSTTFTTADREASFDQHLMTLSAIA